MQLEKQALDATAPEVNNRDLSDLRVLAVDDNATNRRILLHQLKAWKIQTVGVAAGRKPWGGCELQPSAPQPYHLALLDVQMPEMDGLTLARAIKADAALAGTRLIALTSFEKAFCPTELKGDGVEAYLAKPVKQSRLFDCMTDAIDRVAVQISSPKTLASASNTFL